MTIIAGGEFKFDPSTQHSMITYGAFRLLFEPMAGAVTGAAAVIQKEIPDGFGQFAKEFAEVMLVTTAVVVTWTCRILAWIVMTAFCITLVVVEIAQLPDMVIDPSNVT